MFQKAETIPKTKPNKHDDAKKLKFIKTGRRVVRFHVLQTHSKRSWSKNPLFILSIHHFILMINPHLKPQLSTSYFFTDTFVIVMQIFILLALFLGLGLSPKSREPKMCFTIALYDVILRYYYITFEWWTWTDPTPQLTSSHWLGHLPSLISTAIKLNPSWIHQKWRSSIATKSEFFYNLVLRPSLFLLNMAQNW